MHNLGIVGHMRRIYDASQCEFLQPLAGMNRFISISAFLLMAVQLIFALNFILSWFKGKKASNNPWNDNGLEWSTPSPPPHGNFPEVPTVYRGAYEFSSPLVEEDFLPQNRKLDSDAASAGKGS
jgi:cytochrome c oxidase subunit 1